MRDLGPANSWEDAPGALAPLRLRTLQCPFACFSVCYLSRRRRPPGADLPRGALWLPGPPTTTCNPALSFLLASAGHTRTGGVYPPAATGVRRGLPTNNRRGPGVGVLWGLLPCFEAGCAPHDGRARGRDCVMYTRPGAARVGQARERRVEASGPDRVRACNNDQLEDVPQPRGACARTQRQGGRVRPSSKWRQISRRTRTWQCFRTKAQKGCSKPTAQTSVCG